MFSIFSSVSGVGKGRRRPRRKKGGCFLFGEGGWRVRGGEAGQGLVGVVTGRGGGLIYFFRGRNSQQAEVWPKMPITLTLSKLQDSHPILALCSMSRVTAHSSPSLIPASERDAQTDHPRGFTCNSLLARSSNLLNDKSAESIHQVMRSSSAQKCLDKHQNQKLFHDMTS